MNKVTLTISALVLSVMACSLTTPIASPPTATPPGPTLPPPTEAVPVSTPEVSVVIPNNIAGSVLIENQPDTSSDQGPDWSRHPAYIHLALQGYAVQGTMMEPGISVYPVAEFSQISPAVAQEIANLQAFMASPNTLPPKMPFLPFNDASQVFRSNTSPLSFRNGQGVRYLTQFDQAPLPINNQEIFYTFQGLTTDGRYYVSAVLPVNATFLGADSKPDTPIPSDGVPFDWNDFTKMPAYVEAVRIHLESTGPEKFTPNLNDLDTLMQSLYVNLP